MRPCKKCGGKTHVLDTRQNFGDEETYRLCQCYDCGRRFKTVEYEIEETPNTIDIWNSIERRRMSTRRSEGGDRYYVQRAYPQYE